jgi:glycerol-3-phosphate dehydrogenase
VSEGTPVAVVGGGVVGAAVIYSLARRGVEGVLLEAEAGLALGASGANSGILHTGFDSTPGELETELIRRSALLRDAVLDELGVPVLRCGAVLRPRNGEEVARVAALAENASLNGVTALQRGDGSLEVPGEAVTDPVAFTYAMAGAAAGAGATVLAGAPVEAIEPSGSDLVLRHSGGAALSCRAVVNCAGLYADAVARSVGDSSFSIYPRKGEFLVFPGELDRILLPVPSLNTKGVLVFPTVDGHVIVGPTAHDIEDKDDWTVSSTGREELLAKAGEALPMLAGTEPIFAYAGLRPAGRGSNYVVGPSSSCPSLINAAAIRSTGVTASLGVAAYVCDLLAPLGIPLGPDRALAPAQAGTGDANGPPWWRRVAAHRTAER